MDANLWLPVIVIFISVGAACAAGFWLLTDPQVVHRRLTRLAPIGASGPAPASVLDDDLPASARRVRAWLPKSAADMGRIERMLGSAGYHGPWATIVFAAIQVGLPIVAFLVALLVTGQPLVALFAAGLAYYAPTLWLGRAVENRRREIRNGLPDAIDLLIVCIESGSGIDQALNRVAEELALPYPALARELELMCAEMRAGRSRLDAFRSFAERTRVDDVRQLVAMLVQTDRFGTSIGQALRTHAETSRTKRRQRAEEKSAKLGVKLLFPLVFCLFPAFYLVVLGPSMIRILGELVWGGQ